MYPKRILLFSLLFYVILASLLYYVIAPVLYALSPLRRDPIPEGAYLIPWMQPSPSIDTLNREWFWSRRSNSSPWDLDMIMPTALKLSMTFNITTPKGTRVIPSTVYLGHDTQYLYLGGKFQGIYRNPTAGKGEGIPQYFAIFFDVNSDGVLTFPESGSRFAAALMDGGAAWGCDDMLWSKYRYTDQHEIWLSAENYYESIYSTLPTPATLHNTWEYDNSTGTWTVLFTRYLFGSGDSRTNTFHMRDGERWAMGFNLELGYMPNAPETGMLTDGWPRKTYPYLSNDASWWPRLVIDLADPPSWLAP